MSPAPVHSRWLLRPRPNPRASLRLFCFPYAGVSATLFHSWPDHLPDSLELIAIQLPGRGSRLLEPAFTEMEPLVETLAPELIPYFDKPFALFGHSMGALIVFELAHYLRRPGDIKPAHIFVSGCSAPHLYDVSPTYNLPDEEFLKRLKHLGGTPEELLENRELMNLMLPTLRADFQLVQTYSYATRPPLNCPITAFGGMQDEEVSTESLEGWREHTTRHFSSKLFTGNHFFIHTSERLLLDALSLELSQLANQMTGI